LIKAKSAKLTDVSFERIRDELFKIFDCPGSWACLVKLDKLKVLTSIIPEIEVMRGLAQGPYHHLDVWRHSLEALRQMEELFEEARNNPDIQGYINEVVSSERKRRQLMKLGVILHDIGKPKAKRRQGRKVKFYGHERYGLSYVDDISRRLKLSNDETSALRRMVMWHLRPGYLGDTEEPSGRAIFRYFRDAQNESVSTLMLSIADQRATRGRLTTKVSRLRHERVVNRLIKEYFRRQKEAKPVRIVNGDDLIREFKLSPSPLIGEVLSEIEESQAIGKVKTKAEALILARKLIRAKVK
jgi:poly(A) polymerase